MRKTLIAGIAAAALAVTVAATPAHASTTLVAQGSSFAGNLLSKATSIYTADKVTYTPNSSGEGRTAFTNGTVQFAMSDSTYSSGAPSNLLYIPVTGGPIAFIYNQVSKFKGADGKQHYMPKNLKITGDVAEQILTGQITKWNDPAIKALNPKAYLPTAKIRTYYRNNASGTTKNMITYFWNNNLRTGLKGIGDTFQNQTSSAAVGYGTDKSATLIKSVRNDAFGFGYVDLSDAATVPVNKFLLKNNAGQFVAPSVAAGQKFLEHFDASASTGLVTLDFTLPISGAYQLTIITYALAHSSATDSTYNVTQDAATRTAVKNFLTYLVTNKTVRAWEASHGYVPLTTTNYNRAQDQLAKISTN
jgi:phosphate transport system substrate-binding protein